MQRLFIRLLEGAINLAHPMTTKDGGNRGGGYLLGTARHPYHADRSEDVFLSDEDLKTHLYFVGATGSGKTKLIEYLLRQIFQSPVGFAVVDAHSDLVQNAIRFLASLAESDRTGRTLDEINRRLVLIEPLNSDVAVGFNPLESSDENRYAYVLELIGIFRRLWSTYWGARMEELLRNSLLTLSANKLTLLEAKRLLTDRVFRQKLTAHLESIEVREYWTYRYDTLSDKMQSVYREPILNRLSIFTTDSRIRSMVGQSKSTINFREAMDQGKWILVNLGKGHSRDNSYLLGGMILIKIQQAAASRLDIAEGKRRPFFLVVDEFQNFLGNLNDFEVILSESRKYALSLIIAHQNMAQLDNQLRSAILGNVGTKILFRLSHRDASEMSPELSQRDRHLIEKRLVDLKIGQAYLKKKGEYPVIITTARVPEVRASSETVEMIRNASYAKYARSRVEVEAEIQRRIEQISGLEIPPVESKDIHQPLDQQDDLQEGFDEW